MYIKVKRLNAAEANAYWAGRDEPLTRGGWLVSVFTETPADESFLDVTDGPIESFDEATNKAEALELAHKWARGRFCNCRVVYEGKRNHAE